MRKIAYDIGSDPFVDAIIEYTTHVGYSLTNAEIRGDGSFCIELYTPAYVVKICGYPAMGPEETGIYSFAAKPHDAYWTELSAYICYDGSIEVAGDETSDILRDLRASAGGRFTLNKCRGLTNLFSIVNTIRDHMEQFKRDYENLNELARTIQRRS